MAPDYLQNIAPARRRQSIEYNLRNRSTEGILFQTYKCRTERYKRSFLPNSVTIWNKLVPDIREAQSVSLFKRKYGQLLLRHKPPGYYYTYSSVAKHHTRFRLDMCTLNAYMSKLGIIACGKCQCGAPSETIKHYLLECPNYAALRREMLNETEEICREAGHLCTDLYNILLHGNDDLSVQQNAALFHSVQKYMQRTSRF